MSVTAGIYQTLNEARRIAREHDQLTPIAGLPTQGAMFMAVRAVATLGVNPFEAVAHLVALILVRDRAERAKEGAKPPGPGEEEERKAWFASFDQDVLTFVDQWIDRLVRADSLASMALAPSYAVEAWEAVLDNLLQKYPERVRAALARVVGRDFPGRVSPGTLRLAARRRFSQREVADMALLLTDTIDDDRLHDWAQRWRQANPDANDPYARRCYCRDAALKLPPASDCLECLGSGFVYPAPVAAGPGFVAPAEPEPEGDRIVTEAEVAEYLRRAARDADDDDYETEFMSDVVRRAGRTVTRGLTRGQRRRPVGSPPNGPEAATAILRRLRDGVRDDED